jgi:serine/threonine protein kinase/2-polyprenyl-3-methyl-5-hydroxy-6-metoxy-1,4-benzoquinol methylase
MNNHQAHQSPQRIGPYRVLEQVYCGNFSIVYRCLENPQRREVALKTARTEGVDHNAALERLQREARIRALLEHGNILPLYRVIRPHSSYVLVGPWLNGGTLAQRISKVMSLEVLLAVADGIGSALDTLHASGWTHGDINNSNILFASDGRPVLIDFACSRRIGERWLQPDMNDQVEFTPHYVPPEAWLGLPVDGRGDLYGLGVLLYHELTGVHPFDADDLLRLAELHCEATVTPPSKHAGFIGPNLDTFLLQCLAKDPSGRYQSGREFSMAFATALQRDGLVSQPVTVQPGKNIFISTGSAPSEPVVSGRHGLSDDLLRSAGERLKEFAERLSHKEQIILQSFLDRAEASTSRAIAEVESLTMNLFGPPAALLALEAVGATDLLAESPSSADEVASACGLPERTVQILLDALCAAGLVGRNEANYFLPVPLATLYNSYSRVGSTARPIMEAATFWSHLPGWVSSEEPYLDMNQPDGVLYSQVVETLGSLSESFADRLAGLLRASNRISAGANILDIGAGSGVWSLAIAATDPGSKVTAVDRPAVLEKTRAYFGAAGKAAQLTTIAGDWKSVALPPISFDVAILANVCHLESSEDAAIMVQRFQKVLNPDGVLLIIDTFPDQKKGKALHAQLSRLRLGLRTHKGDLHNLSSYRRWIQQAGLVVREVASLDASDNISAIIATQAKPNSSASGQRRNSRITRTKPS